MPNQVVTVNRKKYAANLMWQPVGAGFVSRTYARSLARSVNGKYTLFTEYHAMVGLGARRFGHRIGMTSLAAEVMNSLGEYNSFLAVFATSARRFYLVAARNGVILFDQVFSNESDARSKYFELSKIPDWNALFAPGAWGMPRAIERNLSDLVRGHTHAVLHQISRFQPMVLSMVVLIAFIMLLLKFFSAPIGQMLTPAPQIAQINPELAAEYKRQIEEKNRELDAQFEIEKATPPPPLVLPYEHLPNRAARTDLCYRAIGFVMQPIPGWIQVSAECGDTHAMSEFRRGTGTLGDFYSSVANTMPWVVVDEISDDRVRVRAALPKLEFESSLDERDAQTIMRDVTTLFQSADMPIESMNLVMDTITNGVDVRNLDVVEIAAESKLIPAQFMKIFEDFGGVHMTRAAWDAHTRTWNYEVIIYAK